MRTDFMSKPGRHVIIILRAVLFVDAVVFLTAALLNLGTNSSGISRS